MHSCAYLSNRFDAVYRMPYAVAGGRLFRADFRVVGTRVLVEFDGAVKYADGRRATLFEEKRREDALRREGWVVVRLVWADLDDPERVRRLVLDAVARAA
jgi:very-short-patch-repair endonuclease